jgi:hypothetical protein
VSLLPATHIIVWCHPTVVGDFLSVFFYILLSFMALRTANSEVQMTADINSASSSNLQTWHANPFFWFPIIHKFSKYGTLPDQLLFPTHVPPLVALVWVLSY